MVDILVTLTSKISIPGEGPIIFIGPNGSGKTRFASQIATSNNAEFIGALRNIALEDNISTQSLQQATQNLENQLNSWRSQFWNISNEISYLFSKLISENSASAVRYRDLSAKGLHPTIEQTKLMQLTSVWSEFFPGREIQFETYSPRTQSTLGGSTLVYPARQMSDGERVALYLGARVLDTQKKIIIIDEPEIHFHSLLAVRFWNAMQNIRQDARFIYVTHDLTFALSRQAAQFVIIRPKMDPELVSLSSDLTKSLAESILGAASFSVYAKRLVFCEGDETSDYSFYSNWFNAIPTAVIPVGSCKDVIDCSQAISNPELVTGVEAIGIIDRDYWPDHFISSLPNTVKVLPVHEIENIFCLQEVFDDVGHLLTIGQADLVDRYKAFVSDAKAHFTGGLLAKQISERFKRRCTGGLITVVNALNVSDDLDALESQYITALQPANWDFDPQAMFNEERKRLEDALSCENPTDFLRLFPGKVMLPLASKYLGIDARQYRTLINNALVANAGSDHYQLRLSLEKVLSGILPPR